MAITVFMMIRVAVLTGHVQTAIKLSTGVKFLCRFEVENKPLFFVPLILNSYELNVMSGA